MNSKLRIPLCWKVGFLPSGTNFVPTLPGPKLQIDWNDWSKATTGEPFVTLTLRVDTWCKDIPIPCDGETFIKAEGDAIKAIPLLSDDPESDICEAFWKGFLNYANQVSGGNLDGYKLYLRQWPELTHYYRAGTYVINARFIISNKPEILLSDKKRMSEEGQDS